jgi:hypothetical protein
MKKEKRYDAVAEVRKIREKNSLKYWNKPELRLKHLAAFMKEYNKNNPPTN